MELATHTFSHVPFDSCSQKVANDELESCVRIMEKSGTRPTTIVFPGNLPGHFDVLRTFGITAYRGEATRGRVGFPTRSQEGVWNIPSNIQIGGIESPDRIVAEVKTLIQRAIRERGVCHVWVHPEEIDRSTLKKVIVPILAFVKARQLEGTLWATTMREIAQFCESRVSG
jgi:hypothetical protein